MSEALEQPATAGASANNVRRFFAFFEKWRLARTMKLFPGPALGRLSHHHFAAPPWLAARTHT